MFILLIENCAPKNKLMTGQMYHIISKDQCTESGFFLVVVESVWDIESDDEMLSLFFCRLNTGCSMCLNNKVYFRLKLKKFQKITCWKVIFFFRFQAKIVLNRMKFSKCVKLAKTLIWKKLSRNQAFARSCTKKNTIFITIDETEPFKIKIAGKVWFICNRINYELVLNNDAKCWNH